MTDTFVPRTERERWQAIADALNEAAVAGMPVGIDLDGTLTDHNAWSVVWDRDAERWTVAGYEDVADGEPPSDEHPFTDAYIAFMQFGTMPCLRGLRAELRIEGYPPLIGRYAGAAMRKHPDDKRISLMEPLLVFEDAGAEQPSAPAGDDVHQQSATVEFSVDGAVSLDDWHTTELAPDYYGWSHKQIGGWLPKDYADSVSSGTNQVARATLPGQDFDLTDFNVTVEVKGYGGPRKFMKIQWRHEHHPSRDRSQGGDH